MDDVQDTFAEDAEDEQAQVDFGLSHMRDASLLQEEHVMGPAAPLATIAARFPIRKASAASATGAAQRDASSTASAAEQTGEATATPESS